MHSLILEEGSFGANPGTKDLARHLYTRMFRGSIVIVAERPAALLGPLRKQWLKLARNVQKERARTLDAERIAELSSRVARMQSLRFSASWRSDDLWLDGPHDVSIATAEQLLRWPPDCWTMYVTCEIKREDLYMVTAWMPKGGLVVTCKLG